MSDATTRPRKARIYRPVSLEYYERTLATVTALVNRAVHGDAKPLHDFFAKGVPRQLSEEDCDALAWLIDLKMVRHGRGITRKNAVIQCAAFLLRTGLDAWCRAHGRKRAVRKGPHKAPWEDLETRAIEFAEQEMPEMRGRITPEAVRDAKPTPQVVDFCCEYMPDAIAEMVRLGRLGQK